MFTGIIEEKGKVKRIEKGTNSLKVSIYASKVLQDCKIGDSIASNGVCLTVTNLYRDFFQADVMPETFDKTNLKYLKTGDSVNLETALTLQKKIGGHIVQGHVDDVGVIEKIGKKENAHILTVGIKESLSKYIIKKGSIAVDGVSLTVVDAKDTHFSVSIIPHTGQDTILLSKSIGQYVNIECDVIGKYLENLMGFRKTNSLNMDFLRDNGFL